jgi:hypothetical protein
MRILKLLVLTFAVSLLLTGPLAAGEKKLMHCFAYTVVDGATEADWQAFYKATDQIPSKIPGVSKVWYGKLLRPLAQFATSGEARKKLAAGEKSVTGDVTMRQRQAGVCMEMADEAALKSYASHPYHKEWEAAYSKVRMAGTTTFDILGQ